MFSVMKLLNFLQSNSSYAQLILAFFTVLFQFYTFKMGCLKANKHQVCCLL